MERAREKKGRGGEEGRRRVRVRMYDVENCSANLKGEGGEGGGEVT